MRARAGVALAALLLGCAIPFEDVNPFKSEITIENEMEIGTEVHEQVRASGLLITDPVLLDYLLALGQQIVSVTEPQPFIYRFNLIESDELNAFAVPGGYIYLHSGVLAQVGDVSELAGVLAHEIAHVRRRHIAKAQEGQTVTQLAALAATVLSGGHPAAVAVAQGINVSLQIQHTRENEVDADDQGFDYMVLAGYDPRGMIRFFQRILADKGPGRPAVPPYLFTHPDLKERIAAGRVRLKRSPPPPDLISSDPRLGEMQARLTALLNPVAGGSGVHARPRFDREKTDPLLEKARLAMEAGQLTEAEGALREAEALEPSDPRVAIELAEVAMRRDDFPEAATQLERAAELDPSVALVHYKLGLVHKRLGNRSQAVFHLEQAVGAAQPGSSLQQRARLEIRTLSFPLLESAGIGTGSRFDREERTRFRVGETVTWWGSVSRHVMVKNPRLQIRWIDPDGQIAKEDDLRMDPFGRFSATLDTRARPPGAWEVRVVAGDSRVDRRSFRVEPVDEGDNGHPRAAP
jgi:predicted Zn-dependent protease